MNDSCPVVWPAAASPDALQLRPPLDRSPEHGCVLPSAHVRGADPRPHLCACGGRQPVRDVEVAA